MKDDVRRMNLFCLVLAVLGLGIPALVFCALTAGVPSAQPLEAWEALRWPGSEALLVDVRDEEAFRSSHVDPAVSLPLDDIVEGSPQIGSVLGPPGNRRIFIMCRSGISSVDAVRRLREKGYSGAVNVAGGMEAWIREAGEDKTLGVCGLHRASSDIVGIPFRRLSRFEEYLAFVSGLIIKPSYSFLSLVLVVLLWRKRTRALAALKWAMIFFVVGENFCAANYVCCGDGSPLLEIWHCVGMAFCFGLVTFAINEAVDAHMVQYSARDKKCSMLGFCRSCAKYKDVSCGLQKLFLFLCPAMAFLALMPLTAQPVDVNYNSQIFGAPYNYSHSILYQLFEIRFCPSAAIVLFAAATLVLLFKRNDPVHTAKVVFACGMGALGFSMLRFVIFRCYQENLMWFVFWEEATEMLLIVGLVVFLHIFRKQLRSPETKGGQGVEDVVAPQSPSA
ncbi:MAG: rhodanese-like domain-containing protein [Planctomycetota bacterium]|nr:rhodanese-like domain-containing protein [Planctomycetota bacterium]